ncbi:MAG: integrase core domain-containing protein [Planctomycetota bacterium]
MAARDHAKQQDSRNCTLLFLAARSRLMSVECRTLGAGRGEVKIKFAAPCQEKNGKSSHERMKSEGGAQRASYQTLHGEILYTLKKAKVLIEAWRVRYNTVWASQLRASKDQPLRSSESLR